MEQMTVGFSHFALACVRESVSDLGYGHDDISCMTYDINVDILLECVCFVLIRMPNSIPKRRNYGCLAL